MHPSEPGPASPLPQATPCTCPRGPGLSSPLTSPRPLSLCPELPAPHPQSNGATLSIRASQATSFHGHLTCVRNQGDPGGPTTHTGPLHILGLTARLAHSRCPTELSSRSAQPGRGADTSQTKPLAGRRPLCLREMGVPGHRGPQLTGNIPEGGSARPRPRQQEAASSPGGCGSSRQMCKSRRAPALRTPTARPRLSPHSRPTHT